MGTISRYLAALVLMCLPVVASADLVPFTNNGITLINDTSVNVIWAADANLFMSQYGSVATIVTAANQPGSGLAPGLVSAASFQSA